MTAYLIHSSILLAGIVIFYWLLLRKETFFVLNRWTFVLSIVLSLLLPLVSMPASLSLRGDENRIASIIENISASENELIENNAALETPALAENAEIPSTVTTLTPARKWSINQILFGGYFLGVVIFAFIFVLQVVILLTRKYNLNAVKTGNYTIVELIKEEEPYSFMNTIFINPTIYDPETYEQIIEHEKLHIDQAHFIDKILAELTLIIFWFNPFAWVLRSAIGKNLEFLTDQTLLKNGMEKESYQLSLLKVSVSTKPFNLTTSYNNSFLKNRILMMNSKNSSIASTWKYLFILPLFFLSLISLNAVEQQDLSAAQRSELSESVAAEKLALQDQKNKDKDKNKDNAEKQKDKSKNKSSQDLGGNQIMQTPGVPEMKLNEKKHTAYGSGNNYTKELKIDDFHQLLLSVPGKLNVQQGNTQRISINGPEDIVEDISTEVIQGEWNIRFKSKHNKYAKYNKLIINVTVSDLSAIGLNGVGSINSIGSFDVSGQFTIGCSGVGDINFDANADRVMCAVSGVGNINLKGSADFIQIAISGSGNVMTQSLQAKDGDVRISGSGNSSVYAADNLNVIISGSGTVNYRGNPKLKTRYSGTGRAYAMD